MVDEVVKLAQQAHNEIDCAPQLRFGVNQRSPYVISTTVRRRTENKRREGRGIEGGHGYKERMQTDMKHCVNRLLVGVLLVRHWHGFLLAAVILNTPPPPSTPEITPFLHKPQLTGPLGN